MKTAFLRSSRLGKTHTAEASCWKCYFGSRKVFVSPPATPAWTERVRELPQGLSLAADLICSPMSCQMLRGPSVSQQPQLGFGAPSGPQGSHSNTSALVAEAMLTCPSLPSKTILQEICNKTVLINIHKFIGRFSSQFWLLYVDW